MKRAKRLSFDKTLRTPVDDESTLHGIDPVVALSGYCHTQFV